MIKLYGVNQSRSTRVLWALEEAAQDYQYTHLSFHDSEQRQPEYLKLNPAAKVPVLEHDGLILTESAAIINYVVRQFAPALMPTTDNIALAEYDRWCYFVLSELEQSLWTMGKHKFALPKEIRVPEVRETAQWEYQQALSLLSQGLDTKPYILGEAFSAADILITHTLLWGVGFKQPLEQENLVSYLEKNKNRAAFIQAQQREANTAAGETTF